MDADLHFKNVKDTVLIKNSAFFLVPHGEVLSDRDMFLDRQFSE